MVPGIDHQIREHAAAYLAALECGDALNADADRQALRALLDQAGELDAYKLADGRLSIWGGSDAVPQ